MKLSSRRENSLKKCVLRAWALVTLDLYAKKEKKKGLFLECFISVLPNLNVSCYYFQVTAVF